jgi:hypothetical protein
MFQISLNEPSGKSLFGSYEERQTMQLLPFEREIESDLETLRINTAVYIGESSFFTRTNIFSDNHRLKPVSLHSS